MIGAVAGIAGSVVSAMGAAQQADAQAAQMEYNAKVARINARSSRFEGQAAREQAQPKQDAVRGQLTAAAGKNNVDPFFGSALSIFGDNEQKYLMDQENRYLQAESKAVGDENKARDLEAQAAAVRSSKGTLVASSILSGIGGAAGSLKGGFGGQSSGPGALFINS